MKYPYRFLMLFVLALSLLLGACSPRPAASPTPEPAVQVSTLEALIAGLQASGVKVEEGQVLQDSFFAVGGKEIKVNGITLSAWEFKDEAEAQAAAGTIGAGGFTIGTTAVDWIDQPNFFSQGRLIALYVGKDRAMIDLLTRLLGDRLNEQAPTSGMVTQENAPFALAAKVALAQKLGIPQEDVVFLSADSVEWPNSCLGLAQPDEMCAEVITPGYQVTLEARGSRYTVHTDEAGSFVRIQE